MLRVEVSNFRAFGDPRPARFVLGDGFAAFIGLNNSGKSSLLRLFYELRPLLQLIAVQSGEYRSALNGIPAGFTVSEDVGEPLALFNNVTRRPMRIAFEIEPTPDPVAGVPAPSRIELTLPYAVADLTDYMQIAADLAASLYIGAFRNAINTGAATYYDLEVGQGFVNAWDTFKTGGSRQNTEAALEVTRVIRDIFGFDSLELNAARGDQNLQVVVDGTPYLLQELGGGLVHFILVLAYVATRRPRWLFIDEPELNLHPSLQLDFLVAAAAQTTKGIAFASHSVGLARAAADRTYAVRKLEAGVTALTELEDLPRLSEFLGELSFDGYRELGFGAVLLVEGATDVRVFQQLLRQYNAEHETLVMPLGGADSINGEVQPQLEELKRITDALFAVVDSERSADGEPAAENVQAFERACAAAGVECLVLHRRAIENYFTDTAVQATLGDAYRAPAPYDAWGDLDPRWNKRDTNWRIARALTRQDTDATDLGPFLESVADAARGIPG